METAETAIETAAIEKAAIEPAAIETATIGTAAIEPAVIEPAAIETQRLRKVYPPSGGRPGSSRGAEVVALEGLDLAVRQGEVFGLLGPNGAGKTTTVAILTTRALPTAGGARVAGVDVVGDPIGVRRRIGVVPQRANPDSGLSVVENLVVHATYFAVPRRDAARRAEDLLEQFEIADKRDVRVDTLSGGQLQRLMLARAMMHDPEILFLDEPTVGLDPQVRLDLWDILRDLHRKGRTIVLTTHYMEEAEQLCDRVAILDRGRLLVVDSPERLRASAPGGNLVELILDADVEGLKDDAQGFAGVLRVEAGGTSLRVYTERTGETISALLALAERRGHAVQDIHLLKPSLETLFIHLTGRKLT